MVEVRRQRRHNRDDEQIACGKPLHHRRADVELLHEGGEQHVRHRLREDADEGHESRRHNGEQQFGIHTLRGWLCHWRLGVGR